MVLILAISISDKLFYDIFKKNISIVKYCPNPFYPCQEIFEINDLAITLSIFGYSALHTQLCFDLFLSSGKELLRIGLSVYRSVCQKL